MLDTLFMLDDINEIVNTEFKAAWMIPVQGRKGFFVVGTHIGKS
jgi:hypothetical protein